MSKGANTRETIIGEALSQAVELGLEGVTLGVLASRLNLSKSGLFAHFKSKEALQIAVLEAAVDRFRAQVATPAFAKPKGRGRVAALFEHWLAWLDGGEAAPGCLFVTAAQEYVQRPGPVRDLLVRSQVEWHGALRWATAQAMTQGDFRKDLDPDLFVFQMIGIALGYQHMQKLMNDPEALGRAHAAFDRLLADAAPAAAASAGSAPDSSPIPPNQAVPGQAAPGQAAPARAPQHETSDS
ncbi:TetR/AcrR family transcriptional regulator [Marinibaculum pumilum]|uniref:TetR/AcrR family transcriptional regulator n=1 Tax=Marinibaculum pumilum TaxID=1766165 RepID=A0ABV7L2S1_9PROT